MTDLRTGGVRTVAELGAVLRELRRRHARRSGGGALTYRELAAATGWSHGIIGEYLAGRVLPPTDRFDTLVRLFGASPAEQGALATARDRVEEGRRRALPVPRQLPLDAFGFTGRGAQLAELDALLDKAGSVVCAIAGTAGVGKTALAVHFAHRVADRFPDGQLYVDLRGYGPEPPVPPDEALSGFLRALGVAGTDIPAELAERSAHYRTVLAGRRILVLLDNAAGAEQVRPLLPGTAACFALVTSRDDLAGLVARDGARRLDLDVLREPEALALLRTLIGARVDDAAEAARALACRCARLPLALRIAAEAATANPGIDLADLAGELRDEQRGLDLFDTGDSRTAVRSVFSWSRQRLSPGGARAFGLLGLHPGRDIDAYAVAALAGAGLAEARDAVRELARAHLIEPAGAGRYAMHDLLRAYAVEVAHSTMDNEDRDAARSRLLDHILGTAARATATLYPHDQRNPLPVPVAVTPAPPVSDASDAMHWLDRQRPNLVAAAVFAARHGFARHAADLSCVLWRYFEVGGHDQDALAVHEAAAQASDGYRRAGVLANLGGIHWWLGNHDDASRYFGQALAGYREHGDRDGEARVLARLGLVHERLGDYEAALTHLRQALELYRDTGNRHGQAAQLLNIGALHRRKGRYAAAAEHHRQAATLFAELGDRRLEGYALGNLGAVQTLLGQYPQALAHLSTALRHCRASADRGGEGSALGTLGALYRRLCRYPEALDHLHRALAISRETGESGLEVETLNTLGETLHDMRQYAAAVDRHRVALALAERTGDRFERARALDGTARALYATGETAHAQCLWEQALRIYASLDVPEARQVRIRLA